MFLHGGRDKLYHLDADILLSPGSHYAADMIDVCDKDNESYVFPFCGLYIYHVSYTHCDAGISYSLGKDRECADGDDDDVASAYLVRFFNLFEINYDLHKIIR